MISNIRQILALPPAVVADRWGNHRFGIFSVSIICVHCALHYGLRADIFEGMFFMDKTGVEIVVSINAIIFVFTTFVKNTPLYEKIASKV